MKIKLHTYKIIETIEYRLLKSCTILNAVVFKEVVISTETIRFLITASNANDIENILTVFRIGL